MEKTPLNVLVKRFLCDKEKKTLTGARYFSLNAIIRSETNPRKQALLGTYHIRQDVTGQRLLAKVHHGTLRVLRLWVHHTEERPLCRIIHVISR